MRGLFSEQDQVSRPDPNPEQWLVEHLDFNRVVTASLDESDFDDAPAEVNKVSLRSIFTMDYF